MNVGLFLGKRIANILSAFEVKGDFTLDSDLSYSGLISSDDHIRTMLSCVEAIRYIFNPDEKDSLEML